MLLGMMCQVRNYPIFWESVIYGQSLPRYPHTVSESKSLCGYLGKLFALYDRFPKNWVVVCTQQKNTFCQFRLPFNHQIWDLGSSSYRSWCAKSKTTQFFGNRSYKAKVCPDIRVGISSLKLYADIWAIVMEPGLEPEPENPGLCIKFGTRVFKIKTRETRVSTFFEKPGKMQYFLIVNESNEHSRTIGF